MKKKILGGLLAGAMLFSFNFTASADTEATEAATRYKKQDVTAYVGDSTKPILTSWGTTPTKWFTVAVHPKTFSHNNATAVNSGPLIPYGSYIYTDQEIWMPGFVNGWDDMFRVEDLGDLANTRGLTKNWFDIYFGPDDGKQNTKNQNEKNADNFGKLTGIDYEVH